MVAVALLKNTLLPFFSLPSPTLKGSGENSGKSKLNWMIRNLYGVGCKSLRRFCSSISGTDNSPSYMSHHRPWRKGRSTATKLNGPVIFAVEVLRVIGLSPCQPDHAFESSTAIKVITMQILWPSSSLWKVHDPVTKELRNHFDGE